MRGRVEVFNEQNERRPSIGINKTECMNNQIASTMVLVVSSPRIILRGGKPKQNTKEKFYTERVPY